MCGEANEKFNLQCMPAAWQPLTVSVPTLTALLFSPRKHILIYYAVQIQKLQPYFD